MLPNPPDRQVGGKVCIYFSWRVHRYDARPGAAEWQGPVPTRSAKVRELVTPERSVVCVVDDDESVRESLPDLLRELGFEARVFSSAEEFLKSGDLNETKCLILDVAMPGMSGPELYDELKRRQAKIPVIFITAPKDETVRPRMLARGAVDCLFKPFSDTALLKALNTALPKK